MRPVRRALVFLLALTAAAPALGSDAADLARLRAEYLSVAKDQRWPQVRHRRAVIRQVAALKIPGARAFLLDVFRKDKEQACRVPAMMALGRSGTPKQIRHLVHTATRDRNDVYVLLLPDTLEKCEGKTADEIGAWLAETYLTVRDRVLRAAVIRSLGHLGATEAVSGITKTLTERKADVRILYESLIALARIEKGNAIPHLVPYLRSREPFLREGAVTALGLTGDAGAVEIVLPLASDPAPRVREAVAEFIRVLGIEKHLPVLIEMLSSRRIRVVAKARDVLEELTGEKLGFDPGAWRAWIAKKQKKPPVRLPDSVGSVSTYYGMEILTDRVLFLVDASGSMNAGKPRRIEIARKELGQALGRLSKNALFNVVGFGGSPMWWSDRERPATPMAIEQAKKFVEGLSVGGETNLYDTLVEALERNREADTIFLLGDGCPSAGKVQEHDEILARIGWLNRMRKVRIHCVALVRPPGRGLAAPPVTPSRRDEDEREAADLLNRLALGNGGSFTRRYN